MKKILSFVLVLAMIASMMCVSVSAAGKTTADDFIGSDVPRDGSGGVAPNDENVTAKKDWSVTANVTGDMVNRYAVDLEYSVSNITIDSNVEWNVNTLNYEGTVVVKTFPGEDAEGEDIFTTDSFEKDGTVEVGYFTVTNYSDLAVTVDFDTALGNNIEARTDFSCKVSITENNKTIAGAYNADGEGSGIAKFGEYTATITSADWAHAQAQLMQLNGGANVTIATITISVAPQNSDHLPTPAN